MAQHAFSNVFLPNLGPGTGLAILGFRAYAFGRTECCCVQSGFSAALGADAPEALADLLTFTRVLGASGTRKIGLTAPGCARMTQDELSIACALAAAQAWDQAAVCAHLSRLLGTPASAVLQSIITQIGDTFAGHGLGFEAPADARAVPAGTTPAFRLVSSS
ncbi:MAG: hypothetical protein AAF830_10640 [Pseudomonadota bacterium]